jgi:hypothetical protein
VNKPILNLDEPGTRPESTREQPEEQETGGNSTSPSSQGPGNGTESGDVHKGDEGYVLIPKALVYAGKNLKNGEFRLLVSIMRFSGKLPQNKFKGCWPSREKLALMMGIGVTQVSNLTSILKDKKLVRTSPGGPGGTNLFYPQAPPAGWIRDTEAKITEAKKKTREEKERKWREGI